MSKISLEKATKIMENEFSREGINDWRIINCYENGFNYTRKTEYIRCLGIIEIFGDEYSRSEIIVERYK